MNIERLKQRLLISSYILLVVILTYTMVKYVGQRTEVIGGSMEPTFSNGDQLYIDKICYKFRDPERLDIVVFPYRNRVNVYYIKRIIGLPGDTVYIDPKGKVYINDEVLEEDYIKEYSVDRGIAATPITLGEDEYFVMGDNRGNSIDSRNPLVGILKREEIIGRAIIQVWPLEEFKFIKQG